MSLMSLLLSATFFCTSEVKPSPNDSIPIRSDFWYKGGWETRQSSIKQRMAVFAEATGREWVYKFLKEPDGKYIGMFCNKVFEQTLRDRKHLDFLMDSLMVSFFEDFIFGNNLRQYKALCFCFTNNTDSCFEVNGKNVIYTYHYKQDMGTALDRLNLMEKAFLCAVVLGQGAKADLFLPGASQHPGEIVLYIPREPKDRVKDRIKDYADKCARLAYLYLLNTPEAKEKGYRKISICYFNNGSPADSRNVWACFSYDNSNPAFIDL